MRKTLAVGRMSESRPRERTTAAGTKFTVAPLSSMNLTDCPDICKRTYQRSLLGVDSVKSSSSVPSSRPSSQTSGLRCACRGRVDIHTDSKCDFLLHFRHV